MTSRELNRDQFKELCQNYITNYWTDFEDGTTSPSYADLAHADELVDEEVIHRCYSGINFSEDDFFCSCNK